MGQLTGSTSIFMGSAASHIHCTQQCIYCIGRLKLELWVAIAARSGASESGCSLKWHEHHRNAARSIATSYLSGPEVAGLHVTSTSKNSDTFEPLMCEVQGSCRYNALVYSP